MLLLKLREDSNERRRNLQKQNVLQAKTKIVTVCFVENLDPFVS